MQFEYQTTKNIQKDKRYIGNENSYFVNFSLCAFPGFVMQIHKTHTQ